MGQYIDYVSSILGQSERRAELAAQNLANLTTPGYKRRIDFAALVGPQARLQTLTGTDFSTGKPVVTENPYDLSLGAEGFFAVRKDDAVLYTRQGQFKRTEDGRLLTVQGHALQLQGGGDVVVQSASVKITADGVVLDDGQPVGRLAIVDSPDRSKFARAEAGLFSAPTETLAEVENPVVRQGVLESSNVSSGDEMVALMEALRRAESGQRLANVYDDLMGRAITTFGQV
ncbi:flagellar hook-basal body protein [Caulobacter radicis]|jgi:flagellar basal-body rod protein FlgG|uniref:Flagellar hook basal-body protein n=1 Tax=Caulobacter radicis TaxID=2172650 RepID=A0A2T9JGR7_9CAUL|nr:flagellar hook-basal body complex protein [Caulobacter radicis]PVM82856.1 flagellar hook basal-body protein [Caulobacter radicis]